MTHPDFDAKPQNVHAELIHAEAKLGEAKVQAAALTRELEQALNERDAAVIELEQVKQLLAGNNERLRLLTTYDCETCHWSGGSSDDESHHCGSCDDHDNWVSAQTGLPGGPEIPKPFGPQLDSGDVPVDEPSYPNPYPQSAAGEGMGEGELLRLARESRPNSNIRPCRDDICRLSRSSATSWSMLSRNLRTSAMRLQGELKRLRAGIQELLDKPEGT
jgi:hypothetical protein